MKTNTNTCFVCNNSNPDTIRYCRECKRYYCIGCFNNNDEDVEDVCYKCMHSSPPTSLAELFLSNEDKKKWEKWGKSHSRNKKNNF